MGSVWIGEVRVFAVFARQARPSSPVLPGNGRDVMMRSRLVSIPSRGRVRNRTYLASLAALETGGFAAELNLLDVRAGVGKVRSGHGGFCTSRGTHGRYARPVRRTLRARIGLIFFRFARAIGIGNRLPTRASTAQQKKRPLTYLQGGGGSSEGSHLAFKKERWTGACESEGWWAGRSQPLHSHLANKSFADKSRTQTSLFLGFFFDLCWVG